MLAAQMQGRTTLPAPPPHSPLHASQLLEAGKMPPQEIHDAVRWLAPVMTLSRKAAHEVLQGIGIARFPESIVSGVLTPFVRRLVTQTLRSLISQLPVWWDPYPVSSVT